MSARRSPARRRVGRVSYYQHHGSWYLYFRDQDRPRRIRIGRSEVEAERAAALKNVELLAAPVAVAPSSEAASVECGGELDRRAFVAAASALLTGLSDGCSAPDGSKPTPALRYPTMLAEAPSPASLGICIGQLRREFLDHHEQVLGSALATVQRYAAATQHLVNFAKQQENDQAAAVSGTGFTRYLRTTEVAANGHPNARRKPLSETSVSFTLQTCGAMYRFGSDHGHLPKNLDNPFKKLRAHRLKVRRAKPIFVFDEQSEMAFFRVADPWSLAVHFTLAKTGLRPGELVHTLIEDVDLETGWLRVRAKPELGWDVKTGTDRAIPLAPEVCHLLRQSVGDRTAGPVFLRVKLNQGNPPQLTGNRVHLARVAADRIELRRRELGHQLTRREQATVLRGIWRDAGAVPTDRVRTSFIRVAKRIGIDATCPKSWRHTFATLLQEANVDPLIRQVTLGHKPTRAEQSPLGMTGVYTHTQPEVQHREILRALQLRQASLGLVKQIDYGN